MKPILINENEILLNTHKNFAENQPVCPLCGEKKDSLVNCGVHDNSFSDTQRLESASNSLYDIIGSSAFHAFDTEERDCFVCTDCRMTNLQYSSFCPLYVLYQGIYAFIDEQKFLHNRDEEEAIKLLWNHQSSMEASPSAVIHRYRITSAFDGTNILSSN